MHGTLLVVAKVVRGLNEPSLLFDHDLNLVEANAAFSDLCGVRSRHLRAGDRSPFDLLRSECEDPRAWAREALSRRQTVRLAELNVFTLAGRALKVHQSFIPIDDPEGQQVGLLVTYRNVTDESRLQEHFRQLLGRERQRAEALETAVEARTKDLLVALEQVTHLSRTDPLTGVLNRRSFTEEADRALRQAERGERATGLILLDLDHFKRINDRHGHLAGDRALKVVADAFKRALPSTDILGRFGGEEFVAIMPDASAEELREAAERCCEAIRTLPFHEIVPGGTGRLTVSIGVAGFPADARDLDELIQRADQALYAAKAAGRDRVRLYAPELARLPSRVPDPPCRALVLDGTDARAELIVAAIGPSAHCEVTTSAEEFRRRCAAERFDVLVAAHELSTGAGEDALHSSIGFSPETLRILVIESEKQFAQVSVGLPNAIDLCLLRADAASFFRPAIEDGLTRREISRERILSLSRRSLGVWNRHVQALREYLASGEVDFHFQPIVSLTSGAPYALEMLCRPQHPVFTNPLLLVDACLRSGLICEFGRVVRQAAVRAVRSGALDGPLFVNLHPAELTDPEFSRSIPDDVLPHLVFEINERASVLQVADIHATLRRLRARSFRFAIDDLGAGYASLNAVALVGAEFVKLDMEMVRGLSASARKFNLVNRIVQFADDEGIAIVAEGVETAEDAAALRRLGCHLAQGYHFGRPRPLAARSAPVSMAAAAAP